MLELIRNIFSLTFKNFTTNLPMRYSLKKKRILSLSLSLDNYQKLNPDHIRGFLSQKYNHHHISLLKVELFNVPFINHHNLFSLQE